MEQRWARILTPLVRKVHLPFIPKEFTVETIDRWRIEKSDEAAAPTNNDGNVVAGETEERSKKPAFDPQLSASFWLRHALAIRFLKVGGGTAGKPITPRHEDKALRLACFSAYRPHELFGDFVHRKDFEYPNLRYHKERVEHLTEDQRKVIAICNEHFSLDKNDFVERVILNENFWRRRQEREFLEGMASGLAEDPHSDMAVSNLMRHYRAQLMQEQPQLFRDDDLFDAMQDASVDDLLRMIIEDNNVFRTMIEDLVQGHEKLADSQISDLLENQKTLCRQIIDEAQRKLDTLDVKIANNFEENSVEHLLSSLSPRLSKIEEKIMRPSLAMILLLISVGVVIGSWLTGS